MKKILLATLISTVSFYASADFLYGGDVEVNAWQQDQAYTVNNNENDGGSNTAVTFEASFEHFIPLIPNAKFAQSTVDGDYLKYTKRDYILYYEFLDNDLISLDAGVGVSQFTEGEYRDSTIQATTDFDGYLPVLYANAELGIPGTPLFVFAKGNGISYSGHSMIDYSVGAKYEIGLVLFDLQLQAGYRSQTVDLDGSTLLSDLPTVNGTTDGFFAGVNLDF